MNKVKTTRTRVQASTARQVTACALFLAAVVAVAGFGGIASAGNTLGWYADVTKVPWNPPNWLFGPAWTLLYFCVAVAGFLIWRAGFVGGGTHNRARPALAVFIAQLALNAAWTPVFFAGYPAVGAIAWWIALGIMTALIGCVAWLIVLARRWSRIAALILLPYLAWLCFAASLNLGIIVLN